MVVCTGSGGLDALGNPIGGDFAMFYIAGEMALHHQWSNLYNEPEQQAMLLELMPGLPGDTYLPYRYPPLVAVLMSPLARLPYLWAFLLFSCASLAVWMYAWRSLTSLIASRNTAQASVQSACMTSLMMAPVMLQTLIDGQASMWTFAIAGMCWLALHREQPVRAGMWLALAALKPNVMLLVMIVLLLRYPRMWIGFSLTGCVMFLLTLATAGSQSLKDYMALASQLASGPWGVETPYWKVESLIAWFQLLCGSSARSCQTCIGIVLAVVLAIVWCWMDHRSASANQRRRHRSIAWCFALVINALFNPYTPVYDLTLLLLALFAGWQALSERDEHERDEHERDECSISGLERWDARVTIGVVLFGPILSQMLSQRLGSPLQFMPLALLVLAGYWGTKIVANASPKAAGCVER